MDVETALESKGRQVRTVAPDAAMAEALRRLRDERIGALVVSEGKTTVAGTVSDRGIMDALADRGAGVLGERVGSVMTGEVVTCSRHDRVSAVMAPMTSRRIRHVPVVGDDGQLCGLVSIGDVVKHQLDEIQRDTAAMREYIGRAPHRLRRWSPGSGAGGPGAAAGGTTMTTGKSFDHQRALSDPCGVFGEPANVLPHPDLDARQKREILENWWQDGLRMSESAGENMRGGEEPMLKRVRDALRELERQTGAGAAAPGRATTS